MSSRLRIAFYGDDFTGSTDAAECLAFAGLRTILFLAPPNAQDLAKFPDIDAFGVAGESRSMRPVDMRAHLPDTFDILMQSGVRMVHYKTCSTFDSSAEVGSIGLVMDIVRERYDIGCIPIVIGAPALGRYCLFGNLFARAGRDGDIYRLDRHPTMSAHPITPMDESDMRLHLARQTKQEIASFNYLNFSESSEAIDRKLDACISERPDAVLFDVADEETLPTVGRLVEKMCPPKKVSFIVGSSGVEYALTKWWTSEGGIAASNRAQQSVSAVEQILVVSGSASPVTRGQIDAAVECGYVEIALDAAALLSDQQNIFENAALDQVIGALVAGKSVIVHTCKGSSDPRLQDVATLLESRGLSRAQARTQGGRELAIHLGSLLKAVLRVVPLKRVVISGGDTSTHAAKELGFDALEILAPIAPGGPLCRALAPGRSVHGLEIALKGGQVGDRDFFEAVRMAHKQ